VVLSTSNRLELFKQSIAGLIVEEKIEKTCAESSLHTRYFGKKAIYYPSLTSTMDVARDEAIKGTAEGTVIIAGEQTGGRGRAGRTWLSPRGNVALSIVLYPEVYYLPFLVMIASISVVRSIEKETGSKIMLKWPNDILIGKKKIGGILIENEIKQKKVLYAIIGIGINTDINPVGTESVTVPATCLKDELGVSTSRTNIIRHTLEEMEKLYLTLPNYEPVVREWRARLVTLGRNVRVCQNGHILEGIAETVDTSGALLLRHDNGSATAIFAGDVMLGDTTED
jgi:BirA family biotin operon repressor/biotin-[acetyl-CoA-carboxylase] ligase